MAVMSAPAAPWFVVVERETLTGQPLPAYTVGPFPDEQTAAAEGNSDSGVVHALLTVDAAAEGYVAGECYWTDNPPDDAEHVTY